MPPRQGYGYLSATRGSTPIARLEGTQVATIAMGGKVVAIRS